MAICIFNRFIIFIQGCMHSKDSFYFAIVTRNVNIHSMHGNKDEVRLLDFAF